MLTHPTLEQMRTLKLDGMAQAFIELESQDRAKDLDHAEWLALLLDRETTSRATRRFETRMRKAHLRHSQASIEDVDYRTPRRLDKALFQQLAACRWIVEHRGLLVTGPCGVGKSWLACALGQKPVATASLSTTRACRACLQSWSWPMVMADLPSCSARSPKAIC